MCIHSSWTQIRSSWFCAKPWSRQCTGTRGRFSSPRSARSSSSTIFSSVQTSISSKPDSQFAFYNLGTEQIFSGLQNFCGLYPFYLPFNAGLDSLKGALITSLMKQGNIFKPAEHCSVFNTIQLVELKYLPSSGITHDGKITWEYKGKLKLYLAAPSHTHTPFPHPDQFIITVNFPAYYSSLWSCKQLNLDFCVFLCFL